MRKLLLVVVLFAATAVPAMAFFGLPTIVFDPKNEVHFLAQLQHQVEQIQQARQMVQSDITNLQRLATAPTYANVQAEVSAIATTGKQVAAEARGTVAAGTVVADSSSEAAEAARLNGLAQNALGATQQAQVANAYAAQTNNLLEQGNVLNAQGQLQHAAEERAHYQGLADTGTVIRQAVSERVTNDL